MPVTFNFKGCFTASDYNASKKGSTNQPQAGHTKGPLGPLLPPFVYHKSLPISSLPSFLSPTTPSVAQLQHGSSLHSTHLLTPDPSKAPDPCPRLLAVLADTSPAPIPRAALAQAPGRCAALTLSPCPRAAWESAGAHARVASVHAWLLSKAVQREPPGGREKSQSHL